MNPTWAIGDGNVVPLTKVANSNWLLLKFHGNLVIGESATIVADIQAYNITVSGTIKGNITANKIEIMETGKVWGDLSVNSLLLNEGAFLRGNTNMQGDLEPPVIEAPKVTMPRLVAPPIDDDNL